MVIERSLILPFSVAQMYALVLDIEAYPQFLGWCTKASVLRQTAEGLTARIDVAYAGITTSFTTCNTHRLHQSIDLSLVDGPFKSFSGQWQFLALGEQGSKVSLHLDFEVDTRLVSRLFGKAFEKIAKSQLQAFQARAQAIYKHG